MDSIVSRIASESVKKQKEVDGLKEKVLLKREQGNLPSLKNNGGSASSSYLGGKTLKNLELRINKLQKDLVARVKAEKRASTKAIMARTRLVRPENTPNRSIL